MAETALDRSDWPPDADHVSTAPWVHPTALCYGAVTLGPGSSLWPHVVCRAEDQEIRIGAFTNVQDFVMIHLGAGSPSEIGAYCSITHHCTVHGAKVGDNCLIGINATLMDGCEIGANSVVAGHSIVPEGKVIPPNSVVMGAPGKVRVSRNCFVDNRMNAWMYWRNAQAYREENHRLWADAGFKAEMTAERARLQALATGTV